MKSGFAAVICATAIMVALMVPIASNAEQVVTTPPLWEQLQAQYRLARVGGYGDTRAVLDPGTVLTVQKGGILGIDPVNLGYCPAKYQNSTLKPPNAFCATMAKNYRNFEVGEKVYVTKIDVVVKDEKISMKIVACDACNGTTPATFYKSQVEFIFAKGFLEKPDVAKIEDTIGEVFSLESPAPESPATPPPAAQTAQPAPAQPPATPAPSATIQIGQTIDQVVAAFGQPEKKVDLGSKQIYVYKDLKVTFLNGKVSDVQ